MPPDGGGDRAHAYDFRALESADLPMVERWLRAEHVARRWGEPERDLAAIAGMISGRDPTRPFAMLLDGRPVGTIQVYDIHAERNHPYADQPPGSLGIDLSIGEAALVGRGHETRFIAAFARALFAAGAARIVIDPDPANAAALRAYEKAGFRPIGRRTSVHGHAQLMVLDPDDKTS